MGADGTLKHAGRCVVPLRPTENLGFSQEIINNSGLYKLVLQLIDNRSKGQDEQIDLYLALVGEMANISHVRGRKFVVGFIKAGREYFNGSYSDKIVYQKLEKIADEVIDLSLTDDPKYYIHALDKHPSVKANMERAELVSGVVEKYLG